MRIKKFRHQVFQPVPSSISNKCDSASNLISSDKKEHTKCRNKFWISQQPLEKIIFSAPLIISQKTSNKSESEQQGLSECHTVLRYLHTSPGTEARKIRTHFDTGLALEPPANPKDASISIISLGSWRLNVTMPAGSYDSGILRKWSVLQELGEIKAGADLARPPTWEWHH